MKMLVALPLLVAIVLFSSCQANDVPDQGFCRIYFLDVGQGDCTLIRTNEGDVLIDSGPEDAQSALCRRLKELGVTELALAVFTHPDEDHIGGADGVLTQIRVRQAWLPDAAADNESALRMEAAIQSSGAVRRTVTAGDTFRIGELFLAAFSPMQTSNVGSNDSSIVLRASFGAVGMMFMGDASLEVEQALLQHFGSTQFRSALYKVGHHGSSTSNSAEWLAAVKPTFAVICSSADNSYGHPHGAVIQALEAAGAQVLTTASMGELVFECDKNTVYLIKEEQNVRRR